MHMYYLELIDVFSVIFNLLCGIRYDISVMVYPSNWPGEWHMDKTSIELKLFFTVKIYSHLRHTLEQLFLIAGTCTPAGAREASTQP